MEAVMEDKVLEGRLASLTDMIDSSLDSTPGIAISIIVDNEVIYSKTTGTIGVQPEALSQAIRKSEKKAMYRQIEADNPPPSIDADKTAFLIASITKTFLAMICLQCQERGEVDLDTDINVYLSRGERYPVLNVINPQFPEHPITIRHLLTHSSGLQDDESALEHDSRWRNNTGDSPYTLYDYVSALLIPTGQHYNRFLWDTRSPPGKSTYHYSNAGFTLLGLVIEQVMNLSLNELAHRDIFDPLGMTCTDYFLSYFQQAPNRVQVAIPHDSRYDPIPHYGVAEWPACQIRTTLHDLTLYLLALTASQPAAGISLLSQASRQLLMPTNMMNGLAWWGKDTSYGDRRGEYWGHGGFMEGVRTHIVYFPAATAAIETSHPIVRKARGAIILMNGSYSYYHILSQIRAILLP